ncbi:galactose-3-O-sulfotransferase 4 isoform X2 [Hemitrygon akajei]|uniref:galactose-3-O-sulfotransferase 4 isoform X2 n=1 Tax=Hemitrygon akajei TaxID=2704970 RepID=UPI003BF9A4AB
MRKLKISKRCTFHVLCLTAVFFMTVGLVLQAMEILDIRIRRLQPWIFPLNSHMDGTLEKSCQPKTHVMFLKTHKTASSTILNILYRFGEARDLTFALPTSYQFGYPSFFNTKMVKSYNPNNSQEYHIICNHMRFYQPQIEKLMPPGTFYFSILRDPVTLAESSFNYYKEAFLKVCSLEQFLAEPWRYYTPSAFSSHYAKNPMWFDFGFNHNTNNTEDYVESVLSEIRGMFHLILISEYFDESMVLLKDALCWELNDVVSFRLNARSQDSVKVLSRVDADRIRAWNSLDWNLYLHFNKTFWRKVERYGRKRMADDMLVLQQTRKKMEELCLEGGRPVNTRQIRDKRLKPLQYRGAQIVGYNLNPELDGDTKETCLRMVMPELQYKDLLDAKFFPTAPGGKTIQASPAHV